MLYTLIFLVRFGISEKLIINTYKSTISQQPRLKKESQKIFQLKLVKEQ